jgi:hypothetical protein
LREAGTSNCIGCLADHASRGRRHPSRVS